METCCSGKFDRSLSAETIGNNEDLLTEILLHVPAKSLIRFKSVSKYWFCLISDSRFSMNHTRKNPKPPISGLLFTYYYSGKYDAVNLQNQKNLQSLNFIGYINYDVQVRVWDVCNGLILCSAKCNSLFVCNPTTQKYIKLPKLVDYELCSYNFAIHSANLAFDPSESPHYKVLLTQCYVDYELDGFSYKVCIYSSKSTYWEKVSIDRRNAQSFWEQNRVFWNSAFHWIDRDKTHFRFDLKKNKLTETPKPPGPQDLGPIQIVYNGNCGGRYFLLQTNKETQLTWDVFEMKKDDYSWNVKHTVDFSLTKCAVLKTNWLSVLCVLEGNGRDDLELVIATRDDRVIKYNLNINNGEVLQHSPCRFSRLYIVNAFKHQLIEIMSPV